MKTSNSPQENKSFYNFSADATRVVAIVGVVVIHITESVYSRPDFFGGTLWWITIVLDSLSRISIPLFIMLSGFLILRKDESLEKSIRRIFPRIAVPFLFWLVFYLWYGMGFPYLGRVNLSIFEKIFSVNVYHLYFLVIIMGLYFMSPLIRSYLKLATKSQQFRFMNLLLAIGALDILSQFIFHRCTSDNFFTMWIPYAGFFVAGFLLGEKTESIGKIKLFGGYTLAFLTTLILNYTTYYLLVHGNKILASNGCLSNYSDHYVSINVIVMSLCAFLILLRTQFKKLQEYVWSKKLIQSLAKASFGIYLVHPFVARFLEVQFHLAIDFSTLPIAVIIVSRLVLVFVLSYAITLVGSKIPVVKLVFGEK